MKNWEFSRLLCDFGYFEKQYCGKEENEEYKGKKKAGEPVDGDLYSDDGDRYYRFVRSEMTDDELGLYIKLKQTRCLSHIVIGVAAIAAVLLIQLCRGLLGL